MCSVEKNQLKYAVSLTNSVYFSIQTTKVECSASAPSRKDHTSILPAPTTPSSSSDVSITLPSQRQRTSYARTHLRRSRL